MPDKDDERIESLTTAVKKIANELAQMSERIEKIEDGLSQIAEKAQDAKSIEQWKKLVPLMKRLFP